MKEIAGNGHMARAETVYLSVIAYGAAALVYVLLVHGPTEMAFVYLARMTARFSFLLFVLAFTSSALYAIRESGVTSWLAKNRRTFWLAFALAHFCHLGAIIAVYVSADLAVRGGIEEVLGGMAYLLITAMVIFSVYRANRKVDAFAQKLQPIVAYYVWFIFTATYITRLLEPELREPALLYASFLSVCVSALAVRLLSRSQNPVPFRT